MGYWCTLGEDINDDIDLDMLYYRELDRRYVTSDVGFVFVRRES
jgi:hypothetical protein